MIRIRRLLDRPEPRHTALTPALAAVLVLITAAVALAARQPSQEQSAPKPQAEKYTPYQRWLNQDVAYIITDQERAAFKALRTDEEREHFIQQFWERRNPTPGSASNPFKEEHYRRIAYANERFAPASGLAGWKTDRGRIYITFGPPDEIESHPYGGGANAFPYEQWLYKYVAGMGNNVIVEFDDREDNGEFRMTMDPSGGPSAGRGGRGR
jgi:GWxTD domain-containing protein